MGALPARPMPPPRAPARATTHLSARDTEIPALPQGNELHEIWRDPGHPSLAAIRSPPPSRRSIAVACLRAEAVSMHRLACSRLTCLGRSLASCLDRSAALVSASLTASSAGVPQSLIRPWSRSILQVEWISYGFGRLRRPMAEWTRSDPMQLVGQGGAPLKARHSADALQHAFVRGRALACWLRRRPTRRIRSRHTS